MSSHLTSIDCSGAPVVLPDDILVYATRMFLPDVPGVDLNSMIMQGINELRDVGYSVKWRGVSLSEAQWMSTDPVCIADFVMMFVKPQLASDPRHHDWNDRLRRTLRERRDRFFAVAGRDDS